MSDRTEQQRGSSRRVDLANVFAGATVLIVDDHPPNVALFERILRTAGVPRIHATMDPREVVDIFRTVHPDLVLLDLHMPGMDGVAVMEALDRATPEGSFVPVIVLTADATAQARDRVLAAGASDFLTKPVDRSEVLLRAGNLLHMRRMHNQQQAYNEQLRAQIAERTAEEERDRADRAARRRRVQIALDQGTLRSVYQPVAQLNTGDVVGFEALARFDQQPHQPPNVWFADAADVGLDVELELAAMRAALAALPSLPPAQFLTLNVSPSTAVTPAFAELISSQPRERLIVEITEHAPVSDYEALVRSLAKQRAHGLRLAVDDAGAGFASLHHILRLAPDVIKLDISLVRDIDTDPIKRALASSLVTFGREIGSTIIAEGIETATELAALKELRVLWGQGYYLGRPGPLSDQRAFATSSRRPT